MYCLSAFIVKRLLQTIESISRVQLLKHRFQSVGPDLVSAFDQVKVVRSVQSGLEFAVSAGEVVPHVQPENVLIVAELLEQNVELLGLGAPRLASRQHTQQNDLGVWHLSLQLSQDLLHAVSDVLNGVRTQVVGT